MARYTLVAPKLPDPTLLKSMPLFCKNNEKESRQLNMPGLIVQNSGRLNHDAKLATSSKTCSASKSFTNGPENTYLMPAFQPIACMYQILLRVIFFNIGLIFGRI